MREVVHNFNRDGFDSVGPKYSGGRPPKFTLPERQVIQEDRPRASAQGRQSEPSPAGAKEVVEDISHERIRALLREEDISFQAIKTWKTSNDPDFEVEKNRILELYDLADGKAQAGSGDPDVVICDDQFGPLNLQPHPGGRRAERDAKHGASSGPGRRCRNTYVPHGARHLLAAYDLAPTSSTST